jgi:hypothetical protein
MEIPVPQAVVQLTPGACASGAQPPQPFTAGASQKVASLPDAHRY